MSLKQWRRRRRIARIGRQWEGCWRGESPMFGRHVSPPCKVCGMVTHIPFLGVTEPIGVEWPFENMCPKCWNTWTWE
jgi:hypothetical protein